MIEAMNTALPRALNRLVASNLAAQSAEQPSLAAVPIVAVLALGAGPGEIGTLATAQTCPSCCSPSPSACGPTGIRDAA